ncbi:hypothetical protein F2Q69_00041458 [Brassica cretica]|uniref:Uncharacterized protein n=1 Tax=Brassica cretica TaxID=69181 RepID=A0A8S9NL85_BRACR|nr:hypothetical protein F2Q69_00041458 [Brassica cretica]
MGLGSREISSEQQFNVDFCRVRLLTTGRRGAFCEGAIEAERKHKGEEELSLSLKIRKGFHSVIAPQQSFERLHLFRSISEKSAFPGKNVVHEMDLMTDLLGKPSMGKVVLNKRRHLKRREEIKLGLDLSSFIVQAYQAQFFIVRTEDKIFAEISESLDVNCRITYKDQEAWRKRLLSLVKIKTTWDILGAKLTWRESKRTVFFPLFEVYTLAGMVFSPNSRGITILGPWFYRGINNSGLGGSSMMLSSVYVRPNWGAMKIKGSLSAAQKFTPDIFPKPSKL